jgi:integrase
MVNVARREDGSWRARYRDEQGREHAQHFRRRQDAQRWLDEVTTAVVTGQYVDPKAGRITFASFYREWASRQVWESTTEKAMDLSARTVTFGEVPMNRLRRSHLEQWVRIMTDAGLKPGTIRTRTNNVRAVLRGAVRDRVIALDPSQGLALPRVGKPEHWITVASPRQVRAILDAADDRFTALFALAAFAGLRLGEAAAVQVGDIDFLHRSLRVRRQVQRAGRGAVEIPAAEVPQRTGGLPAGGAAHAARAADPAPCRRRPRQLAVRRKGVDPPHQNTVGHQWRSACNRAGVTGVTLHDLRHFYASALTVAGCDVVTVQRALGHARATTTLNTYAHLWSTAEDRTRQAAAGLMTAVLGVQDLTSCDLVADNPPDGGRRS